MALPLHVIDDILYAAELPIDTRLAFNVPPKKLVIDCELEKKLCVMHKRRVACYRRKRLRDYSRFLEHVTIYKNPIEVIKLYIDYDRHTGDVRLQMSFGTVYGRGSWREMCWDWHNGVEDRLLIDNNI